MTLSSMSAITIGIIASLTMGPLAGVVGAVIGAVAATLYESRHKDSK